MTLEVRRVITAHDSDGKAVVKVDEISSDRRVRRPGAVACVLWSTDSSPAVLDGDDDMAPKVTGLTVKDGSVFCIVRYEPGVPPRRHRTESIDYAIVLSGEIDMELDEEVVHLKAGDTLIQRGTVHNWVNNGTEPCIVAFVLIDATFPRTLGEDLEAFG